MESRRKRVSSLCQAYQIKPYQVGSLPSLSDQTLSGWFSAKPIRSNIIRLVLCQAYQIKPYQVGSLPGLSDQTLSGWLSAKPIRSTDKSDTIVTLRVENRRILLLRWTNCYHQLLQIKACHQLWNSSSCVWVDSRHLYL